jgi:hypothetical protein
VYTGSSRALTRCNTCGASFPGKTTSATSATHGVLLGVGFNLGLKKIDTARPFPDNRFTSTQEREMFNSKDNFYWSKFPAFSHVFGIEKDGMIAAIDGITPIVNNADVSKEIDGCGLIGEKARIHTNGDMFVLIDGDWLRVRADTVSFIERTKF